MSNLPTPMDTTDEDERLAALKAEFWSGLPKPRTSGEASSFNEAEPDQNLQMGENKGVSSTADWKGKEDNALDPAKMGAGQYTKETAMNLPGSAFEGIGNTLHALAPWNWGETAGALKQVGEGVVSKAKGALGYEQNPEEKANTEKAVNQLIHPFTSMDNFWRSLHDDPFSVLTTLAVPLTGGESALAKVGNIAGKTSNVGRVANAASKAAGVAAEFSDPTRLALKMPSAIAQKFSDVPKKIAGLTTGVGTYPYSVAEKIPSLTGENAAVLKNAFNSAAKGNLDPTELPEAFKNAIDSLNNDAVQSWISKSKENFAATQQPADLNPIFDSIEKARSKLSKPYAGKTISAYQKEVNDAHAELNALEKDLVSRVQKGPDNPDLKIESLARLKESLWPKTGANNLVGKVRKDTYHGVRDAIAQVSPEYAELMEKWQNIKEELADINSQSGANRTTAGAKSQSILKMAQSKEGKKIIEDLSKYDPRIPYMVAGTLLHDAKQGNLANALTQGAWIYNLHGIGSNLSAGNPIAAVGHAATLAAQQALQSPRVMKNIYYGKGKLANSKIAKTGANVLGTAERVVAPLSDWPHNQGQLSVGGTPPEESHSGSVFAKGGRIGRKSGGKVSAYPGATQKALSLISLVDKIKKEHGFQTSSILNMDDSTVVHALEKANSAIK